MGRSNSRIRLDAEQRELLAGLLDGAIDLESDMKRKAMMIDLSERIHNPTPGHPIVTLSLRNLSDAFYRPPRGVRQSFIEKRKVGKCEDCGLTEPWTLQIDHIDSDRSNNDISNLRLLCANCHLRKQRRARVEAAKILGVPVERVFAW